MTREKPTFLEQVGDVIEPYGPVKATVGFFVGCMYNNRLPQTALDAMEVLKRNGIRILIPHDQICCGSPLIRTGQITFLDETQEEEYRGLPVAWHRHRHDHVRRLRINAEK